MSGSGKSTLAFDILFNEGQRRYLESLNAYARSIVQPAGRPDVDAVYGIPPTVAIEQRLSRGGRKSTVATTTEVWHFLRLLWVKLGLQHCIKDGTPVQPQSAESIAAQLLRDHRGEHVGLLAPLVVNRKGVYTDLAKWAKARGHTHLRVDGEFVRVDPWPRIDRFKEHTIELPVGDVVVAPEHEAELRALLSQTLQHGKGVMHLLAPLDGLSHAHRQRRVDERGRHGEGVLDQARAARPAAPATPSSTRACFRTTASTAGARRCVGTGLTLTREQRRAYDDTIGNGNDDRGREQIVSVRGDRGRGRRRHAVRRMRRHATEPGVARGARSTAGRSATWRPGRSAMRGAGSKRCGCTGARRRSHATSSSRSAAASSSSNRSASAT